VKRTICMPLLYPSAKGIVLLSVAQSQGSRDNYG
jgi:hypothetical protein